MSFVCFNPGSVVGPIPIASDMWFEGKMAVRNMHRFAENNEKKDLLQDRGFTSSLTLAAAANNTHRNTYRRHLHELVALLSETSRYALDWIGAKVQRLKSLGLWEAPLLVTKHAYDETPLPTRVADDLFGQERPGAAKILQSSFEVSFVLRNPQDDTCNSFTMRVPTWLQAIDRNTAECLAAATEDVFYLPEAFSNAFDRNVKVISEHNMK